jgi:hypothetical protein
MTVDTNQTWKGCNNFCHTDNDLGFSYAVIIFYLKVDNPILDEESTCITIVFFFFLSIFFLQMSTLSEGQSQIFHIPEFSKNQLELLRSKTREIIWPNELEKDYGWTLGAPTWAVKPLVEEWTSRFDWQEPRAEMQRWHHYQMKVDGLLMHYVHERSSNLDAIPIVLLHGWPSTFYEFHKLIEPLRDGLRGNQVHMNLNRRVKKRLLTFYIVFPCHCAKFAWFWIFRST